MDSGIAKAIKLAGDSQSNLARLLGCRPQTVQKWFTQGRPSARGCVDIVRAFPTITLAELDPELYGALPPHRQ